MTDPFREVAITTGSVVATPAGSPFPVQMPSDILAGDWLVVTGGTYAFATLEHAVSPVAPATGWFAVNGPRDIFVKIADGSEAGTLSTEFVTLDSTSLSGASRAYVIAAFSFRFDVQPFHTGGFGPYNACIPYFPGDFPYPGGPEPQATTSADSFDYIGDYPGGSIQHPEYRFFAVSGFAGDSSVPGSDVAFSSATWYDNLTLIQDRTGLHSAGPSGGGGYDPISSWSWATQYVEGLPHPSRTGVVITASSYVGAQLDGFSWRFPLVTSLAYWGILASPITG